MSKLNLLFLILLLSSNITKASTPSTALIEGRWENTYFSGTIQISGNTGTIDKFGSSFNPTLQVGDVVLEDIKFERDDSKGSQNWVVFKAYCKGRKIIPAGTSVRPRCSIILDNVKSQPPSLHIPDECCYSNFKLLGKVKKPPQAEPTPAANPPQKPDPATCSARDIEGNWKRGDGVNIVLNGMDLKDGGRALVFNHPSGWPAGAFKFSGIKQKSGCEFQATCQTVHRNSAGGGYNISKESCTLVLDKKAGTLKAPGSHGSYTR